MFDNNSSYPWCIMCYWNTFHGLTLTSLSCSGTGWMSTTGSAGRWLEQSWRGRAGRRHLSGWSERPSQSSEDWLFYSPITLAKEYRTIDFSAVIIVCIFFIFLCVSHSASFCKAHPNRSFIKDQWESINMHTSLLFSVSEKLFLEVWQSHVQLERRKLCIFEVIQWDFVRTF